MKLNSGEFETSIDDGDFDISITTISDHSLDGGHTFETVCTLYSLDKVNAKHLIDELQHFIDYGN